MYGVIQSMYLSAFTIFYCMLYLYIHCIIVKPVLRGHPWDKEKVAL